MKRLVFLSLILTSLAACAAPPPFAAQELLNAHDCRQPPSGVTPVTLAEAAQLTGRTLAEADLTDMPPLVLVSRGAQPTGGYRLQFKNANLSGDRVTLKLHWQTPPEGAMVSQAITHPCIVLALADLPGGAITVVAEDQTGVIGEASLSQP